VQLLICDFSGHPFQVQLSRELAGRGHDVVHVYCPDYHSGQGDLARRSTDPPTFSVRAISLGRPFEKSRYGRRIVQELKFGWAVRSLLQKSRPDVFVSCNEPLFAKSVSGVWCRLRRQPWVFWLQDLYAVAMRRELEAKYGGPGRTAGEALIRLEGWLLGCADDVVAISPAFTDWMADRQIRLQRSTVIPNWAPLGELPYFAENPGWFTKVGIPPDAPVVLYSGTLGRKHNADLMLGIAQQVRGSGAHVVVISEGEGADHLGRESQSVDNLHVLPFQPWSDFPAVLASAAVLVVVLEAAAGAFSVPSKVLTYLCAGRAIVAAMPKENTAADMIRSSGAGVVVPPDEPAGLSTAVTDLLARPADLEFRGKAARTYAEAHFAIEPIADQWEQRLYAVVSCR
jgi:glycosyltransferase involved in cell wall biosynthesis